VRRRTGDRVELAAYGRTTGLCVDPIEKKPLYHFLPGSAVLSFGTAGCNLGCRYCQNWTITRSREWSTLSEEATPDQIAAAAVQTGCRSVAYTYNDPAIFMEFAIDVSEACHERGIRTVAVTAGYMKPEARKLFFRYIDGANVDLKGFSEEFYVKLTGGHLRPVLDTLLYLRNETSVWLEITNLVIPGHNDSPAEFDAMTRWVSEHLGPETPLHFTAFHPDGKMLDVPHTPLATLAAAREIATKNGLQNVYLGNVQDRRGASTICAGCGEIVIGRVGFSVTAWNLTETGRFEREPGSWGSRRRPVRILEVAPLA
jgi:pyruvate formate lyase activating enzyme